MSKYKSEPPPPQPEVIPVVQVIGRKETAGKADFSLLPFGALEKVVRVLEYGLKKYERDNWKHVPNGPRLYFQAMLRHCAAIQQGELIDPETGIHHAAHIICDALFMLSFYYRSDGVAGAQEKTEPT